MSHIKQIWVRPLVKDGPDDPLYVEIHYLIGYCSNNMGQFKIMSKVLKDAFPEVVLDDVDCSKVHKSDRYKSFTIVSWRGRIEKKVYPDWRMTVEWHPRPIDSANHPHAEEENTKATKLAEELSELYGDKVYESLPEYYFD